MTIADMQKLCGDIYAELEPKKKDGGAAAFQNHQWRDEEYAGAGYGAKRNDTRNRYEPYYKGGRYPKGRGGKGCGGYYGGRGKGKGSG